MRKVVEKKTKKRKEHVGKKAKSKKMASKVWVEPGEEARYPG